MPIYCASDSDCLGVWAVDGYCAVISECADLDCSQYSSCCFATYEAANNYVNSLGSIYPCDATLVQIDGFCCPDGTCNSNSVSCNSEPTPEPTPPPPAPPTFEPPIVPCLAGGGLLLTDEARRRVLELINWMKTWDDGPESVIENRGFPDNIPSDKLDQQTKTLLRNLKNKHGSNWRRIWDNLEELSKRPTINLPPLQTNCPPEKTPQPKETPNKPGTGKNNPPKNRPPPTKSPNKPIPQPRKQPWKLPSLPKFKPPTIPPIHLPPALLPGIITAVPIIVLDHTPRGDGDFYPGRFIPPLEPPRHPFDDWPVWDDGPTWEPPGGFPLPPIIITDPDTGMPIFFDDIDDFINWEGYILNNYTPPDIDPTDFFFQQDVYYLNSDITNDEIGAKLRIGNVIRLFSLYGGYIPIWPMYLSDYYPRVTTAELIPKYHIQNKATAQAPHPNNFLAKSNNGNAIIELDNADSAKFATDINDLTDTNQSLVNATLLELCGGNPPLTEITALVPKE
jgi:hypothetical protein